HEAVGPMGREGDRPRRRYGHRDRRHGSGRDVLPARLDPDVPAARLPPGTTSHLIGPWPTNSARTLSESSGAKRSIRSSPDPPSTSCNVYASPGTTSLSDATGR